jgi:glycosyltransferase involved in cell wall biosynthesis
MRQVAYADIFGMDATRPLRIGINLLFLIPGGVGGTEIYTRNLLDSLAKVDSTNRYFVFRNVETDASIVPDRPNFVDCPQPIRATFRPARILYEQTALVAAILRARLDVVLNGGYTAPLLCPVPMVTVFFDLQYKIHPENFRKLDLLFWRMLLPASARRSRRIVAMSEAARRQIETYYPWCRGSIDIVPHGIERRFSEIAITREAKTSFGRYILAVSTLGPHKNYDGLLRAYARYRGTHPDLRLVIVGIKGSQAEQLVALRDALGLEHAVTFTGWIPREELYELYADALAFAYASKFEGFGIPVLEAIAAGIPTACSAIPSLLEIAEGCVRFFDPNDDADIAASLAFVTGDDATLQDNIAAGRARAIRYDRENAARSLVDAIRLSARREPIFAGSNAFEAHDHRHA